MNAVREFLDESVCAGQLMWNNAFGPIDFFNDIAWIRRDLLIRHKPVFLAPNERLSQIDWIVNNIQPGQDISPSHPECRDRNQVAMLDAVSPQVLFFDMSRRDFQCVAYPLGRIESAPGVRRI